MGNFKFKTQVISTLTLEYHIEADSLEEALEELQEGEHRGRGIIIEDETNWESELITIQEKIEE